MTDEGSIGAYGFRREGGMQVPIVSPRRWRVAATDSSGIFERGRADATEAICEHAAAIRRRLAREQARALFDELDTETMMERAGREAPFRRATAQRRAGASGINRGDTHDDK